MFFYQMIFVIFLTFIIFFNLSIYLMVYDTLILILINLQYLMETNIVKIMEFYKMYALFVF